LSMLDEDHSRMAEFEKTVGQGGEVKESKEKVEYQARVGIILVPLLFDEKDRLYREEKACTKKHRDDTKEGDDKETRRIISDPEKHVKRCESSTEERDEKSGDRMMICLSEMQKFHGLQPMERLTCRLRWDRLFVKSCKKITCIKGDEFLILT
jgi:hypothetical protein